MKVSAVFKGVFGLLALSLVFVNCGRYQATSPQVAQKMLLLSANKSQLLAAAVDCNGVGDGIEGFEPEPSSQVATFGSSGLDSDESKKCVIVCVPPDGGIIEPAQSIAVGLDYVLGLATLRDLSSSSVASEPTTEGPGEGGMDPEVEECLKKNPDVSVCFPNPKTNMPGIPVPAVFDDALLGRCEGDTGGTPDCGAPVNSDGTSAGCPPPGVSDGDSGPQ